MLNPAAIIPSTKKHILMVSLNKSAKSVTVVCFQFAILTSVKFIIKLTEVIRREHK